jgi:CxxC-x17-CxxC domain-containing protein
MEFVDRALTCADCGGEFIFTSGEQFFFFDKQFRNAPKRCKRGRFTRAGIVLKAAGAGPEARPSRKETRTGCTMCGIETTVPFKPTQGRPVLCRQSFQSTLTPPTGALVTPAATAERVAGTGTRDSGVRPELLVAAHASHA